MPVGLGHLSNYEAKSKGKRHGCCNSPRHSHGRQLAFKNGDVQPSQFTGFPQAVRAFPAHIFPSPGKIQILSVFLTILQQNQKLQTLRAKEKVHPATANSLRTNCPRLMFRARPSANPSLPIHPSIGGRKSIPFPSFLLQAFPFPCPS